MVTALENNTYSGFMPPRKTTPAPRHSTSKAYPNRINELKKQFDWNYDDIAERLNAMYAGENFHPKTIGKLARGDAELTFTWMQRLARLFGVKPIEIVGRDLLQDRRRACEQHDRRTADDQQRRSADGADRGLFGLLLDQGDLIADRERLAKELSPHEAADDQRHDHSADKQHHSSSAAEIDGHGCPANIERAILP